MEEKKTGPLTVDDYIAQFPEDVQKILVKIRAVIQEAAPGAEEKISYQMPGYHLNGGLVWFGAYKHHIGFYPKRLPWWMPSRRSCQPIGGQRHPFSTGPTGAV
jgi:hypothetical protein